ncbi:MAG: 50S ribosomal protein L21 [uncultured bacterium]|nr:MAG: 50S ribosomal protein L21 [uncultured bacterium]OGJ47269.1 MAG: 50S ribosomal protein L21 [Candidatus Peregrinibacteria bacterium RIFOXYA2_FULL_41_18]OGJ48427.1 MAG: 50S ribosomal protein L21 [Candidatus Peregrinibacteria bacterium RIFOXYB12_FULL_41_12]
MFAIIELGGRQFKVAEKDEFIIEKLDSEIGKNVTVKTVVLLAKDESDVEIGMPYVGGATVELKVLEEVRGDKVRIFKMKAKDHYEKRQGHVQKYFKVKVLKITKVAGKVAASVKSEEVAEPVKAKAKKAPAKKAVKSKE